MYYGQALAEFQCTPKAWTLQDLPGMNLLHDWLIFAIEVFEGSGLGVKEGTGIQMGEYFRS